MLVINTKRLRLEPLGMKHLKTVHAYASDIENTKYMLHLPNKTIAETTAFLQKAELEWMRSTPSFYEFAVIYKNKQIGAVCMYLNDDLSGELGWIINKAYWKQGTAYEAAKALVDYAAKELKIKHFTAHCDTKNTASYKIMEKLGMSRTNTYGGRKNRAADSESMEYEYELYV